MSARRISGGHKERGPGGRIVKASSASSLVGVMGWAHGPLCTAKGAFLVSRETKTLNNSHAQGKESTE